MSSDLPELLANFGSSIEERVRTELGGTQSDKFDAVADIKNLAGDSTGHINVYTADKLDKAAFLSINIMPGARYFNIHVIPDSGYNIPRFLFEGMISTHGSQVSTDLLPDMDIAMNIVAFKEQCAGVEAIFADAKKSDIAFEPSRQAHMRSFCSPFFLCTFGLTEDKLAAMEAIANRYFDEWLTMYKHAVKLSSAEAQERQARREYMAKMVIELDPDRNMVVQVYGEDTVCAIEDAVMV